jgi:M6 family metalloprotease-like protein
MKLVFQLILILFLFGAIDLNAQTLNKPILEQSLESETLSGFQSFTNVVIFIRFKDEVNYEAPFTLFEYEDMFNKDNDISLKHFFLEASYGKLNIESLLLSNASNQIIFYTDIYNRNYYEPKSVSNLSGYEVNDDSEIARREHGLLKRAITYIDSLNLIDESIDLDVNNDGDIDSLTFMVSGEDSGWSALLWPHQWNLYTHYSDLNAPTLNGLKAYTYTLNLLGNSKDYDYIANVGILAHETFHLLGAPDLYHYYGYDYIENAGPWALMDSNNSIPVHMLGYLKYAYGGWIDSVTTITEPGRYTLGPVKDSPNHLLRFDTGYSNEFVYFEFRVKEGFYESSLPSEGLLVYRVDKDFYGNQDGYSETSNGPGINEVFVFRPYIKDILEPITFPDEVTDQTFDGDISLAALSQFNAFDEANTSSDFLMFHSDGTLMDIRITNVVIENGNVSFTLSFERNISVSLEVGGFTLTQDDFLIDHELLIYEGVLNGASGYDIYMSFDGSEATSDDMLYNGRFTFNSSHKIVHLAFYKDGIKFGDQQLIIPFASSIESKHNPYGNDVYLSFYIPNIDDLKRLTLTFNALFELEDDYDFLYISTSSKEYAYTGTSLRNQVLDLTSYQGDIWIEFITDESEDAFYGFLAMLHVELNSLYVYEDIITLEGSTVQNIPLGSIYNELGLNVLSGFEDIFTFKITHQINTMIPQSYQVTYEVFEGLVLVYTMYRTVHVLEGLEVSFDEIQAQTFELGSQIFDFKTLVNNVIANSSDYEIIVTHDIDFMKTGNYEVVVTVIDDYNFESSQSFSVEIIDTTKPLLRLNASVDTIIKSSVFIDSGISVAELNTYEIEVSGTVLTNIVGRYELTYKVTDASNNVSEIKRIVFVIETLRLELYIEKAVTTYTLGKRVEIPMCHVLDQEELTCEHDADLIEIQQLGTHIITYSYTKDGITSYKVLYIFVIPSETYTPVIMPKREEYNI